MIESNDQERTERLMAMGQMAASLAHEIRNPLGGMELFCSLLNREVKDDPKLSSLTEQILKGIRTVDRIIQNCLQFAREIIPQRTKIISVERYLEEVCELVRPKAQDFSIQIAVSSKVNEIVEFDPFLIQQVLVNLVTNSVDAVQERVRKAEKAGDTIELRQISVSALLQPNELQIQVEDTGEGISEEVIEKIFDPFMTTKTTGTGLGLAITHSIVKAHGGEIKVSSKKGEGSTFTIKLPQLGNFSKTKEQMALQEETI